MDYFEIFPLYMLFLGYLRPAMTLSNCVSFGSVLLIIMATIERLLRTFTSTRLEPMRQ